MMPPFSTSTEKKCGNMSRGKLSSYRVENWQEVMDVLAWFSEGKQV